MKLFEIKIYEPKVEGILGHEARIRYANAFEVSVEGNTQYLSEVGAQGVWPFVDGVCDRYWSGSYCRAEITGEIDGSREMEADRFEPA